LASPLLLALFILILPAVPIAQTCNCANQQLYVGTFFGSVTRLSTLIASGALPLGSAKNIKCIRVEGRLDIDVDYTFEACAFVMMPYSAIKATVKVNKLAFGLCSFKDCNSLNANTMWTGIDLADLSSSARISFSKNQISDAFIAIFTGDNPSVFINRNHFNRNAIGVKVFDQFDDTVSQDLVGSLGSCVLVKNMFDCSSPFISQYTASTKSILALEVEGKIDGVTCGIQGSNQQGNTVMNHEGGYLLDRALEFRDYASIFTQITPTASGSGGIAIITINGDNYFTGTITSSTEILSLDMTNGGVTLNNCNFTCSGKTISQFGGILNVNGGRYESIASSVFDVIEGEISVENTESIRTPETAFNIGFADQINIIGNINITCQSGIDVVSWHRPSIIRDNDFLNSNLLTSGTRTGIGIFLGDGTNMQIAENFCLGFERGIVSTTPDQILLCNNTLLSNTRGLAFIGDNIGTDVWCTNFIDNTELALNTRHQALFGDEVNRGNNWVNELTADDGYYNASQSLNGQLLNSHFQVSTTHLADLSRIYIFDTPASFQPASNWFTIDDTELPCPGIGAPMLCGGVLPNNGIIIDDGGIEPSYPLAPLSSLELRPLNGPVNFSPSELYIHETLKRHLLKRLKNEPELLQDSQLANFLLENIEDDAMLQLSLERELQRIPLMKQVEHDENFELTNQLELLAAKTSSLHREITLLLDGDILDTDVHVPNLEILQLERNQLNSRLAGVQNAVSQRTGSRLSDYQQRLQRTVAHTVAFQNWLEVHKITANHVNDAAFSEVEKSTIEVVADQCLWLGGDAVILARGLAKNWGYHTENNDICDTRERNTLVLEASSFVYPNPSNGIFHIGQEKQRGTFRVTDQIGNTIQTPTLNNQIDLSKQPNGIYFIHFFEDGFDKVQTEKIVKISLK
jgi:Secretion system C-terminal sorting domain